MAYDELNRIKRASALYNALDSDNRREFLTLARASYLENAPTKAARKKPDEKWLAALLSECDPTTGYVYDNEVLRKKAYLTEALAAAPSISEQKKAVRRALSYWTRMTAQYSDDVTGAAVLKAYRDCGVSRVKWLTQNDERVCPSCRRLHGKIFELDRVPGKHWGCRCLLLPLL